MQNITTSPTIATTLIQRAQRMISAAEGRTLDFETADNINRTLLASINALSEPRVIVSSFDEEDTLTDDEIAELESRLYRDSQDDRAYWTGGAR